jgi:hypothetical protein
MTKVYGQLKGERIRRTADRDSLMRLYTHLKKRLMVEYGIEITKEWEDRVLAGKHEVRLPTPIIATIVTF